MVAECQPGWSALQDTFMLGKSRLKDWDKKQNDEAGVEGTGNSSNDSDSEVDVDELQKQGATLIDKTIRDFGYDYWVYIQVPHLLIIELANVVVSQYCTCSLQEIVTLAPHLVDNFKELTDKFYHEHLHPYDESCIILEGNGYWDISDYDGTMIRFRVEKGDMITLPPRMYHQFTMDTNDHIKANAL
ncbi:hypothetical protein L7F22_002568 [Adiantum nelumboides]|nr:hypothetical protein [Adiantum nelumboides]